MERTYSRSSSWSVLYLIGARAHLQLHVTSRGGWLEFNCRVRVRDDFLETKMMIMESQLNSSRHTFDLADFDSDGRPLSPAFRADPFSPFFLSLLGLTPGVCLDCWCDMWVNSALVSALSGHLPWHR